MSIETPEGLLWVVIEHSEAGDTTVGVFTTIAQAREIVQELGPDRLENYRIEGHALDAPLLEPRPWQVVMTRDGVAEEAQPFVGCSCQDEDEEYYNHSLIQAGGERLFVIAFALTPGQAIAVTNDYRLWLQEGGHWTTEERHLSPIHARTRVEPVSAT